MSPSPGSRLGPYEILAPLCAGEGVGVTEEEWNASVQLLIASLDKFKVPEAEKVELLAIAGTLKVDIVEKK